MGDLVRSDSGGLNNVGFEFKPPIHQALHPIGIKYSAPSVNGLPRTRWGFLLLKRLGLSSQSLHALEIGLIDPRLRFEGRPGEPQIVDGHHFG